MSFRLYLAQILGVWYELQALELAVVDVHHRMVVKQPKVKLVSDSCGYAVA